MWPHTARAPGARVCCTAVILPIPAKTSVFALTCGRSRSAIQHFVAISPCAISPPYRKPGLRLLSGLYRFEARPRKPYRPTVKIHEYQAKEVLRKFGVPTPRGYPCFSVDEAVEAAKK